MAKGKPNYPAVSLGGDTRALIREYLINHGGFRVENLFQIKLRPFNRRNPKTGIVKDSYKAHIKLSQTLKRDIRLIEGTL